VVVRANSCTLKEETNAIVNADGVEYSLFHTRWVHVLVRDQNPVVEKYISQACGLLYELLTNAILS
jgi:hypothetical protein